MKNKKGLTSEFLKDCMADAVIKLLEKYTLNEIQVKQICDVSGFHRASWFRAFDSKHEAVTYKMVRLWEQWCNSHGVEVRDEFTLDNAETFFQYNYEVRDITRLLYHRGLMPDLAASFTTILRDRHEDSPIETYPVLCSPSRSSVSCANGLSATLTNHPLRWHASSAKLPPRWYIETSTSICRISLPMPLHVVSFLYFCSVE